MAQDTIDKILHIQFNYKGLVEGWKITKQALDDNKEALRVLKDEYKNGKLGAKEYNQALLENKNTQKALNSELQQYTKEIQNNIKIETQASGSINQLRANVSKLTAQYNALSGAEREGAFGQRLAADIKSQQEAINEAEKSLGNYRSQVGNYEQSIMRALGINTQFSNSFSIMKAPLGVLLGVLGGVVGVVKLFAASIHETQSTGDAFDKEMAGWRNTWDLFKKSVSAVDFSLFIRNAAEAREAGKRLQEVLDELFERTNSISLQRASMAKENAELEEALRNTGLSYEERLKAGEKYKENMAKIYEQEQKAAEDARDVELNNLFALTKAREYSSKEEQEAAKQAFADGIKNYNLNLDKIRAANDYIKAQEKTKQAYNDIGNAGAGAMRAAEMATRAKEKEAEAYTNFVKTVQASDETYEQAEVRAKGILEFQEQYLLTNDKQVDQYVKAEAKALNAQAASYNEQKRISNTVNSVRAEQTKQFQQNKEKELKTSKQAAKTQLQIERELTKAILDLRQEGLAKDLEASEQRFAQERQKLENQLRFDDKLTVKAKEDLNHLLVLLKKQQLNEESKIRQRWSEKEFEEELRNEENRIRMQFKVRSQMDTLAAAQVKNKHYSGLISNDESERLRAQQAIAEEELRQAINNRDILAQMDEEQWSVKYESLQAYETARLESENKVQDAMKRTADIIRDQANLQTQTSLTAMSTISGAATSLFNTLAEDNSTFAGFAKALALFNIGVNTAEAISKAIAGNAARPLRMAAAVAAVLTAIQQAYSVLSQQSQPSTPSFAAGGLVTGPGTGTSDCITARLSNGEAVMTARAVNDWGAMLSAMNVASGGNAISVSNLPQRNDAMKGLERMFERAFMNMPASVVSVVDINKGQKRVKVQNNLGRLSRKKAA